MQRRHITATQRRMLAYILQVPRHLFEEVDVYMKRRERLVTNAIQKHFRAAWGDIQRHRCYSLLGHVARLPSSTHMCSLVSLWRSSGWWHEYMKQMQDKQKQQPGRRADALCRPRGRSWTLGRRCRRRPSSLEFNKSSSLKSNACRERGAFLHCAEKHIGRSPDGVLSTALSALSSS